MILDPYSCLDPLPPVALSDPARSTKLNLPMLTSSLIPLAFYLVSALTRIKACDLEEASLDPVAYLERLTAPTLSNVASSIKEDICISVAP